MIKIGVQTKGILPDVSIAKGFELIRGAGFECIDFNLDSFLTNTELYDGNRNGFFDFSEEELALYFGQYRAEMDRLGLTASQMHAPYPVWVDLKWDQNDYVQKNVIPKSILIAKVLGVPWVVVHPIKMCDYHGRQRELDANIEFYKSIVPILKEYGVGVCVENLYGGIGGRLIEGPCADPEEAIYYVDTMNEYAGGELFGICLDTGHLQLTKRNPADYIRKVGNRIKLLHLHENDGFGDLHQMPFSYRRNSDDGLNWREIAKSLKAVGFEGALSFETHPCMRAFPEEILLPALEAIYAVGDYLRFEMES